MAMEVSRVKIVETVVKANEKTKLARILEKKILLLQEALVF